MDTRVVLLQYHFEGEEHSRLVYDYMFMHDSWAQFADLEMPTHITQIHPRWSLFHISARLAFKPTLSGDKVSLKRWSPSNGWLEYHVFTQPHIASLLELPKQELSLSRSTDLHITQDRLMAPINEFCLALVQNTFGGVTA